MKIDNALRPLKYVVVEGITEQQKQSIIDSMGIGHGEMIIKRGFNENTLPHICMKDDELMHLFTLILP